MNKRTFNGFRKLIYEKSGITLNESKESLVSARVGKRMRELGMAEHKEYFRYIIEDNTGIETLYLLDAISTNFTSFFREPDHFKLLNDLVKNWIASGRKQLKIWSAASSSGEEPYTIAMTLMEAAGNKGIDMKILATDISIQVLEKAKNGVYDKEKLEKIPKILIERYFSPVQGEKGKYYVLKDRVKKLILFKRLNLSKPPFPMRGPLDVIFCRNVMIYFDNALRIGLLKEIYRLLKKGGYLMVGHAESLAGLLSDLKSVRPSVYIKE